MIGLPGSIRIYLATAPADMRKGFDGLGAIIREHMGENPLSGSFFVFRNRRKDRVKILYWDRTGYCLWYKRLERGTFRFPESGESRVLVDAPTLALILEGIDLQGARRQPRFQLQDRHIKAADTP